MDTLDSNTLNLLEINNELKKIEAYFNDERVLKWSSAEVYKGWEEIKALLEEIKLYTEEKCELEKDIMLDEYKIKYTENNLHKNTDEGIKKHSELQILYQQEEEKNLELMKKYEVMLIGKSQRLRDSHKYYDKEYCVKELALMKEQCEELKKKEQQALNVVEELQRESKEITPFVPYDTLNSIMGKEAYDEKLKENNEISKE